MSFFQIQSNYNIIIIINIMGRSKQTSSQEYAAMLCWVEQAILDQGFRREQAAMNLEQRKEEAELARDKLHFDQTSHSNEMEYRRWQVQAEHDALERRAQTVEAAEDRLSKSASRSTVMQATISALIAQNKTPDEILAYLNMLKQLDNAHKNPLVQSFRIFQLLHQNSCDS